MRRIIVGLLVSLAFPASAFAELPEASPVQEPAPVGSVLQAKGFVCETIAGDPALETAAEETPPPVGPEGQTLKPSKTTPSACPKGMLAVTTARPGPRKTRRMSMSEETLSSGLSPQLVNPEYYYYVGDIWQKAKIGYVSYLTQLSGPTVPAGSAAGAHSISQFALVGGGRHQYSIEAGWIVERKDTEEGWLGPQAFFFVNPDNYGELSCYNCGLVLAEGVTESPFGKHYKRTDGTSGSECIKEGKSISPCSVAIRFASKQYKGAWWLWWNGNGGQWIGRVSDEAWGKHFTVSNDQQGYGEVYDTPGAPTTQMGNGNKGNCTCATEAYALALGFKATAKEPEPILSQENSTTRSKTNRGLRSTPGATSTGSMGVARPFILEGDF